MYNAHDLCWKWRSIVSGRVPVDLPPRGLGLERERPVRIGDFATKTTCSRQRIAKVAGLRASLSVPFTYISRRAARQPASARVVAAPALTHRTRHPLRCPEICPRSTYDIIL